MEVLGKIDGEKDSSSSINHLRYIRLRFSLSSVTILAITRVRVAFTFAVRNWRLVSTISLTESSPPNQNRTRVRKKIFSMLIDDWSDKI